MARKGERLSPETIERMRAAKRADWQRPEYRRTKSAQSRTNWTRPEFRERMAEVRAEQPPQSKEARERAAAKKRGRPLTKEHRAKMSEAASQLWATDDYRAKVIERVRDPEVKARANTVRSRELKSAARRAYWAQFTPEERNALLAHYQHAGTTAALANRPPTRIEVLVQKVLDARAIEYRAQSQVGRYFIDFLVPSQHICLECDGDYWHQLPEVIAADARRDKWLREAGYRVVRMSETSIMADADKVVCEALSITQ